LRLIVWEDESKPGIDRYAEILLQSLSRVAPGEDKLEVGLSTPHFVSGWKKAQEKTASAPPIHFWPLQSNCTRPRVGRYGSRSLLINTNAQTSRRQPYKKWRKGTNRNFLMKKANIAWASTHFEILWWCKATPTSVRNRLLTKWEGLISAIDGAIEVAKSTWYFIWDDNDQWQYTTSTEDILANKLLVKDVSGERWAIPQTGTSEAFEILGAHLGPDGSQLAAYNHLLEMAESWADKLQTSFRKEKKANAAPKTTILKKWSTHYRLLHWRKLNAMLLWNQYWKRHSRKPIILGNFPAMITIAWPQQSSRLWESQSVYMSQVVEHLDTDALRHAHLTWLTGKLLQTMLEATATQPRSPGRPFNYTFKNHSKLVTAWWKDIWQ
jgi:hypothetical protein